MYQNGWPSKSYCLGKNLLSSSVDRSDLIKRILVIEVVEDRKVREFFLGALKTHTAVAERAHGRHVQVTSES